MHKGMSQEPSARIDRNNAAPSEPNVLREPAQSKFIWTCHKSHFTQKFIGKAGPRFVRACAVEMHMDISQEPFCAEIYRENAGRDENTSIEHRVLTLTVRTPQCGHTVRGRRWETFRIFNSPKQTQLDTADDRRKFRSQTSDNMDR